MTLSEYENKFEIFEEWCRLKERKKYLYHGFHQYVPAEHINKLKEEYKIDMQNFLKRIDEL